MKKAIQIAYDKEFELKCKLAAEAGFTRISVNFTAEVDGALTRWDTASENILRILERYGLTCVQSHLPYYDLMLSAEIPDVQESDHRPYVTVVEV